MRVSTALGRLSRHPLIVALLLLVVGAAVGSYANDLTLLDSNGQVKTICTDEVSGRNFYCFKLANGEAGSSTFAKVNASGELLTKNTDPVSVTGSSVAVSALPALPAGGNDVGIVHTLAPTPSATTGYTVVRCSDGTQYTNCFGSSTGGTASNFGSDFPSDGTGVGFTDGTKMRGATVVDGDTTGATHYVLETNAVSRQAGTPTEIGVAAAPWRTDPTGTTTQPVAGNIANDAADSGNPEKVGGKAVTADPTAVTANDRVNAQFDTLGVQIVRPARGDALVRGCNTSGGIGDTEIIAAPGAGKFIYVQDISVVNSSASTAAYVNIKSAATVVDNIPAPPNKLGALKNYPGTLRLADNEALNFASDTGVTTMRVCAHGFVASN